MQYLRFVHTTTRIGRVGIPQSIDLESIVDSMPALPVVWMVLLGYMGYKGAFETGGLIRRHSLLHGKGVLLWSFL